MAPLLGYSSTRINSVDSSSQKFEEGRWVQSANFQRIKTTSQAQQPIENRNRQASFATLLKQAEQDNSPKSSVELRPNNRQNSIDILA